MLNPAQNYTMLVLGRLSMALKHGPCEVRALALHSAHLHPHQAHVLQVDAALYVAHVYRLESDGGNKLADSKLGTGVVAAEQHCRLDVAVARIRGVLKVFITVNVEAADNMRRREQLLNNFASAFAVATVSQTGTNRVSAIHDDFPAEIETLHAFGHRWVGAAQEHN